MELRLSWMWQARLSQVTPGCVKLTEHSNPETFPLGWTEISGNPGAQTDLLSCVFCPVFCYSSQKMKGPRNTPRLIIKVVIAKVTGKMERHFKFYDIKWSLQKGIFQHEKHIFEKKL